MDSSEIESLCLERHALAKDLKGTLFPSLAFRIASSRVDIAKSCGSNVVVKNAHGDLTSAKEVYRLYSADNREEALAMADGMLSRLRVDEPNHYLLGWPLGVM